MSATMTLEKTDLKLGFVALLDCAPLVVAREKGFFKKHGLNVVLCKESSWASIRDKVSFGLYDAAHMLAPMPLASTLGLNGNKTPMLTALALSQNGTAITLSQEYYMQLAEQVKDWSDSEKVGNTFRQLIQKSARKPIIATVYPYSNHHYQLRYWLEKQGIDIENDIQLVAVPPTKMLTNLSSGVIDGYCVGEPWNSLALMDQIGGLVTTGHQIWGSHMEKVLGVTQTWADQHPASHKALVNALHDACQWSESIANKDELNRLLALPPYLDQAATKLANFTPPLKIEQHFHGENVNTPDPSHGVFILKQMRKCGQLSDQIIDADCICQSVYRQDLFREWIAVD
jgi:ABC-type nitrate/sulfonate/bicarbonate transport system substrate-binding protein